MVWLFILALVTMVTFARLVIVAQYTNTVFDESQSVFEAVNGTGHTAGQSPHDNLDESILGQHVTFVDHQLCGHVGDNNNTIECCQLVQHQVRLLRAINATRRAGLIGASVIFTLKGMSAFSTAAMTAAIAGIVPPSPAPLTPIGLSGDGVSM